MSSLSLPIHRVTKKTSALFLAFLVFGVAVGFLLSAERASADWIASVVGGLAGMIVGFLGRVLTAEIGILLSVVQYNDFITSPPVTLGWMIVRDMVNMFFVLILLIIALATVMHYEEYTYKKLLKDVIIAAVLVNFSKTIAGFFIDFAQVIMMTFVNGFAISGGAGAGNFVELLQLREMVNLGKREDVDVTTTNLVTGLLLAVVFILIAVVTVGVMLAVFVFRILMLWGLLVLSPLAFFLNSFPAGKPHAQKWWSQFTNFVTVGPVLAFFLWLALATVSEREGMVGTAVVPAGTGNFESVAITEAGGFDSITSFVIGISMLIMALVMAQEMGGVAGQLAGSALSKIQSAGFGAIKAPFGLAFGAAKVAGGMGLRYGERKLLEYSMTPPGGGGGRRFRPWKGEFHLLGDRALGVRSRFRSAVGYLSPAKREGFMARGEKMLEDRRAEAKGVAQRQANRLLTGGKDDIPVDQIAREHVISGYSEDYKKMSRQTFMAQFVKLKDMGGYEGDIRREAILKAGAEKGYLDDAMEQQGIAENYVKLGKEKYGMKDGERYNELLMGDFLYDYMTGSKAGTGREKVMKRPEKFQSALWAMDSLEEIGKSTNHYEYLGHNFFNSAKNQQEATMVSAVGKDGFDEEGRGKGNLIDKKGKEIDYKGQKIRGETLGWNTEKQQWSFQDGRGQEVLIDKGHAVLSRIQWANKKQTSFSISEWNKGTGRGSAQIAPHPFRSICAEDMNPDGTPKFNRFGMAGAAIGGELTWAQEQYHQLMMGKRATTAAEHGQQRAMIWAFGEKDESTTETVHTDRRSLKHLKQAIKASPEYHKLLYANYRNINLPPGKLVDHITVVFQPKGGQKEHHSTLNDMKYSLEAQVFSRGDLVDTETGAHEKSYATQLEELGRTIRDGRTDKKTRKEAEGKSQQVEKSAQIALVHTVGGGAEASRSDEQKEAAIQKLMQELLKLWERRDGKNYTNPTGPNYKDSTKKAKEVAAKLILEEPPKKKGGHP